MSDFQIIPTEKVPAEAQLAAAGAVTMATRVLGLPGCWVRWYTGPKPTSPSWEGSQAVLWLRPEYTQMDTLLAVLYQCRLLWRQQLGADPKADTEADRDATEWAVERMCDFITKANQGLLS